MNYKTEIIKYNFQDKNLFLKSLIHTSASKEKISSMERFEFLGDRVLGFNNSTHVHVDQALKGLEPQEKHHMPPLN